MFHNPLNIFFLGVFKTKNNFNAKVEIWSFKKRIKFS